MMKSAAVLAILVATAIATPVNDCKNGVALPKEVKVSNCDKQPCPLIKGKDVILEVTFQAPQRLPTINTQVIATALGITSEYPLPEPDACKSLINAKCPVEQGQVVTYKLVMPVDKKYPNIPLQLKFSLQDEQKKSFTCFHVNCKVTSS